MAETQIRATTQSARGKSGEDLTPTPTQAENDAAMIAATGGADPPANTSVPHVSGSAAVGGVLSCTMGNWEGMDQSTDYAYQWRSDGSPLPSATDADYTVLDSDAGHSLDCVVTASNSAGSTAAPPSNAVAINGASRGATRR